MLIVVGKLDYFLLSFCCHMYCELNQLSTFFYYFAFILFLDFCYCVSFIVASFNFVVGQKSDSLNWESTIIVKLGESYVLDESEQIIPASIASFAGLKLLNYIY